jgi:hypothetical protein
VRYVTAIEEAHAAGLIRPPYASMRDSQRLRIYSAERAVRRSPIEHAEIPRLLGALCEMYSLPLPRLELRTGRAQGPRGRRRTIRLGGYDYRRNLIWLNTSKPITDLAVIHECAHYVVCSYFRGQRWGEHGTFFEPSHGPWFASVAFSYYAGWDQAFDCADVEKSGRIRFAVSPTTCKVPAAIGPQSAIWLRFGRGIEWEFMQQRTVRKYRLGFRGRRRR